MNANAEETRPSPEALLKLAAAEEKQAEQGKLKIFLGYAAGVGKTYAMLEAARQRQREGVDVVAAYVESHGRVETDALLEGLEVIPKAGVAYKGVVLPEMDIDAVLARKPRIALVDELAHSNAPGSRHEKRWQDVEELLASGIHVYTTVNVQHFESQNDLVAQITGVVVRETVPDSLLDLAFEIQLVDIPPDELLQRLNAGKVYIPEQAAWASSRFFQPGNLIALRELSLRRAAVRVDEEMRAYMEARSLTGPWPAAERLLVCVSGSPFSEKLIRITRRLADELKAPWVTLYVETPRSGKHLQENRERVWRDLRLAESLGAQVATMTAVSAAEAIIDYAVRHNVSRIVVGKPAKPRWREFLHPPIVDQLIRQSGVIHIHVVSIAPTADKSGTSARKKIPFPLSGYLSSLLLVAVTTLFCALVRPFSAPTTMVMLYLLAVVLAALRLGRKPAILTAFLGVVAFDFFFVAPRFSFTVADTEYIFTFLVLFAVGAIISTLVAQARERAEAVREREVQTASLYYLSRDLAVAAGMESILTAVVGNIGEALNAQVAVFIPDADCLKRVAASPGTTTDDVKEMAVADWVLRNRQEAGKGTGTLGAAAFLYLPLQTPGSVLGVLGVKLARETDYRSPQSRRLLEAFASQAAMAMERVQLSRQAEQTQLLQARENLERALLNSISHDLRTPLVTISGALGSLRDKESHLRASSRQELLDLAWEEAERLNRFVGNLLDMTRLEAGELKLKEEYCDVQDMVGCALAALDQRLQGRPVDVEIPADLPLVVMDMVLMTQVLVNLLDNALKYSPAGSPLKIKAGMEKARLLIEVADRGRGIPAAELHRVFDKFYRTPVPEKTGGTGLGLSICKGIVEAHGGKIRAENRDGGGLRVLMQLPIKTRHQNDEGRTPAAHTRC